MPVMTMCESTATTTSQPVRLRVSTSKNIAGGGLSTEAYALAEHVRPRSVRSQCNIVHVPHAGVSAAPCAHGAEEVRALRAWYAVQVRPGHERAMARRIERVAPARVEALVPERVLPFRVHGVWTTRTDALFPGYVLVSAERPADVSDALSLIAGFAQSVGMGKEPVALDAPRARLIESLCADGSVVGVSRGRIVHGALVVDEGPLRGLERIIAKIDRHKRVAYLDARLVESERAASLEALPRAGAFLSTARLEGGEEYRSPVTPVLPRVGLEVVSKT